MKKTIFSGAGVALITPMDDNGRVNFSKLGELIDFQVDSGTDAIVICGTTGESATLEDGEHIETIQYTVKKTAGRIPVVAGTGSNDTKHAVFMSKEAEAAGADAVLLVTPYYNKTTQTGLLRHFNYIADNIGIPAILYNVPSRTGVNLQPQTVKQLAAHPRIAAVKEASGNISQVAEIAALCGDEIDIYSGNDDQTVPVLSLGGSGVISVLSNVMPAETHEICAKYFSGDSAGALRLQLEFLPLIKALFSEVSPIPVKAALNLMGYNVGGCRMPLCDLSKPNLETLKSELEKLNLLK